MERSWPEAPFPRMGERCRREGGRDARGHALRAGTAAEGLGSERAVGTGTALVPCTCGELVQGILDGEPFLVSCPIDRYSQVRVRVEGGLAPTPTLPQRERGALGTGGRGDAERPVAAGGSAGPRAGLRPTPMPEPSGRTRWPASARGPGDARDPDPRRGGRVPGSTEKARRAAALTLEHLGLGGVPFTVEVDCPVPASKGFGSSTADVVGAIAASAAAVGVSLDPLEVARLAVAVEPSDGTMFPGLAVFDHRTAARWEPLGRTPPLLVAVLEFEGTVDTLEYNAGLDLARLRSMEATHREALGMLRRGMEEQRYQLIGLATTASAVANQILLSKPQLDEVIALGAEYHALGVCAAHSGTALGVLFAPEESWNARRLLDEARRRLRGLQGGWVSRMVDGGARIVNAGRASSIPGSES
ncbi:MAG: hypothetical protein ACM3US_05395 [Sphingomonadaceae bacterium]